MRYLLLFISTILIISCADNTVKTETTAQTNNANANEAVTQQNVQNTKNNQQNLNKNNVQKTPQNAQNTAQNAQLTQEQQRKKIQEQIQEQLKQRQQQQQNQAKSQPAADGPEVPWVKIGNVESLVKKKPKKVVVDVYTSWCGPCKMLDRTTFRDPEVVKLMTENFYPVKFNAEGPDPVTFRGKNYTNPRYNPAKKRGRNGQHTLTPTFGIRGYPSIIIMDENMKIIDKASGYLKPAQMKAFLSKHV